jgi:hypothetical protein
MLPLTINKFSEAYTMKVRVSVLFTGKCVIAKHAPKSKAKKTIGKYTYTVPAISINNS